MESPEPMIDLASDQFFMSQALRQATRAADADEVPVGAVMVRDGRIIARAHNQVELLKDPTAHAEMLALSQAAASVGDWRLSDCDLYVTKEPCAMCAGAAVLARVRRVVFGCRDPKAGGAGGLVNLLQHPSLNHRCELTPEVLAAESLTLLKDFFRMKRRGEPGAHAENDAPH
jgi:tRNA(adenine34) deaminase